MCERRLSILGITVCNIETSLIEIPGLIWLRYDEEYLKVQTTGLLSV